MTSLFFDWANVASETCCRLHSDEVNGHIKMWQHKVDGPADPQRARSVLTFNQRLKYSVPHYVFFQTVLINGAISEHTQIWSPYESCFFCPFNTHVGIKYCFGVTSGQKKSLNHPHTVDARFNFFGHIALGVLHRHITPVMESQWTV